MSALSRVFLFDIDGTLLLSGGAGRAALAAAMERAFATPLRHDVDLHGRTDRWIVQQLLLGHGLEDNDANWGRLRDAYLQELPVKLRERQGRVLPGVTAMLQRLLDAPWAAVGLLTGNVRLGAGIKLRHYALHELVDCDNGFGGFGDEHDCRNRVAADALQSARKALGELDPDQIWVIGDTPRDVDCARAIGVRAAAVATGGYTREQLATREPDLLLESLEDAGELLDPRRT